MYKIRTIGFGSGLSDVTLPDPEAVVLVRKIESANPAPLSLAKRANHRYFSMLCEISCELCQLYTPAYRGLRVLYSRLRPNQTLVSYIYFFKTPASEYTIRSKAQYVHKYIL
jgi:hypothetical protein